MDKRIFLVVIIIFSLLLLPLVYSKEASSSAENIAVIKPITKSKPPVFEIPPILSSYCSGSICLPPGETPASLGLNYSSNVSTRDFETTTLDNKIGTSPTTGNYSIPVLLVKFPDLSPDAGLTASVYDDVYNSNNYLSGEGISVSEFYKHNSYDSLDISYDVYDWRTVSHNYSYYYNNNNVHELIVETLNLFGTGSNSIDFTQYDSDGDGRLDGVVLVHAGLPAQEMGNNIISQARIYKETTLEIQGMLYGNVAVVPSRHLQSICQNWINYFNYPTDCRLSIDSAVHEFAHVLGLPDLYELSYTGIQLGSGLGGHTVMVFDIDVGQDHKKPVNFDSWSKFFFGWLNPVVINSASQADIYSLGPYDTSNDAYLLNNPDTMGDREYFLITNRYISDTSLDRYLFGVTTPVFNANGGIDVLHVDEAYIDDRYAGDIAFNSIMYDEDDDYYDDTISHPGIIFEQNILDAYTSPSRTHSDLYTTELPDDFGGCNPEIVEGKFDDVSRIDPNCQVIRDTTSTTYNGLVDSGIRLEGLSESGTTVDVYLTVTEPLDLEAEITSPENNSSYEIDDVISFSSSIENEIGDASCQWQHKKQGNSSYTNFSNQCNLNKTPGQLNLETSEYEIKLIVTDDFSRQDTDIVTINVTMPEAHYHEVLSPEENRSYPYKEDLDFTVAVYNNYNNVSCVWKYGSQIISNDCNFSASPYDLGLASPPYTSVKSNNLSITTKPLPKTNISSKLFKVSQPSLIEPNRSLTYLGNFPAGFIRTLTLTTNDGVTQFTSQVDLKVCLCLLANNNAALPY